MIASKLVKSELPTSYLYKLVKSKVLTSRIQCSWSLGYNSHVKKSCIARPFLMRRALSLAGAYTASDKVLRVRKGLATSL